MKKKLSELMPGQKAIVQEFTDNNTLLKLMEMGCTPGEVLVVDQIAPFGGPISIKVSGYSLSLRKNEAEHIEVVLVD